MSENHQASTGPTNSSLVRTDSIDAASESSQTAQEFIASQLQLEADAREALPYSFDTCTFGLGPLRQTVYSCLTCNPLPSNSSDGYEAAGVCYGCSISCHGEHELVELFTRRNFECDCGTRRMPSTSPCNLKLNATTNTKGGVTDAQPSSTNKYNQNFRNRFCGCSELYNPFTQKGTMFQCLGIGNVEDGACGEDWWHPECVVGLGKDWQPPQKSDPPKENVPGASNANADKTDVTMQPPDVSTDIPSDTTPPAQANGTTQSTLPGSQERTEEDDDPPLPPGFPHENTFDHFICYKCTSAYPWIKRYAGATGFLRGVVHEETAKDVVPSINTGSSSHSDVPSQNGAAAEHDIPTRKRKADDEEDLTEAPAMKRTKSGDDGNESNPSTCLWRKLPEATSAPLSLFLLEDFRDHICHCASCFPLVAKHPQLLEEEEVYEPPRSEGSDGGDGANSVGSRSLLDRGEAALSNMDRVRAIEGVMAYNHVRDKVKDFLKPFAESGTPVGAEDIKKYFAKLRGDEQAIRDAGAQAGPGDGGNGAEGDGRREQRGY